MSFFSVVKVELLKLYHKKTSLLLLLLLVPSVLFGIGMACGLSFFVSDGGSGGVDAIDSSLSAIGFAVNMMEQSKYVLFLVIIILAALSFSGELENGQIKSEIIRICGRSKILLAKYTALLMLVYGAVFITYVWSLLIYAILVSRTDFASGLFCDEFIFSQIGYTLFVMIGIASAMAVTFFLGTKLKTFPCFAISYILWFVSLYTDFIGKLKLLIPYNMPTYILEDAQAQFNSVPYGVLYMGYSMIFLILACVIFKRSDVKG